MKVWKFQNRINTHTQKLSLQYNNPVYDSSSIYVSKIKVADNKYDKEK